MELKAKELKQEVDSLNKLKKQSVVELAKTIQKQPKLVECITRTIRIAVGQEKLPVCRDRARIKE